MGSPRKEQFNSTIKEEFMARSHTKMKRKRETRRRQRENRVEARRAKLASTPKRRQVER